MPMTNVEHQRSLSYVFRFAELKSVNYEIDEGVSVGFSSSHALHFPSDRKFFSTDIKKSFPFSFPCFRVL